VLVRHLRRAFTTAWADSKGNESAPTEQVGKLDVGPATVVLNWKAAPGKKLFWDTPSGSLSALYLTEIQKRNLAGTRLARHW